jgi:ferritin heavy chain
MKLFPVVALFVLVWVSCSVGTGWQDDTWQDGWQADSGRRTQKTRSTRRQLEDDTETRPNVECASERAVCQNFHKNVVKLINHQIKEELTASYVYQAMSFYFRRDDVALEGFAHFFSKASSEEREHAEKFMEYLNKRGGDMVLNDIPKPEHSTWTSGLAAMEEALKLEHHVNRKILDLHWMAQQLNDPHLADYLEAEFLTEQVDSIKQLSDFVTVLKRVQDTPLGEHIFDMELKEGKRG